MKFDSIDLMNVKISDREEWLLKGLLILLVILSIAIAL